VRASSREIANLASRRYDTAAKTTATVSFESAPLRFPAMINGGHLIRYSHDAEADRASAATARRPHVDAGAGWLIFKLPPAEIACTRPTVRPIISALPHPPNSHRASDWLPPRVALRRLNTEPHRPKGAGGVPVSDPVDSG
jgi:hypothetical protein